MKTKENIFLNLDTMIDKNIINYLNGRYSSNRVIGENDIVYSGILYNFIKNENNIIYFHIDELNNINYDDKKYIYYNNNNNNSILPRFTLNIAWRAKTIDNDLYTKINKVADKINLELNTIKSKFIIIIPLNLVFSEDLLNEQFNSKYKIIINKNPDIDNIIIFEETVLDSNIENYNYKKCGLIKLT